MVRNDRLNKRGGGTCIYIHERIHFDTMSNANLSCKDIEMQAIYLNRESNHQKQIIIVLVYRPPSGSHTFAIDMIRDTITEIEDVDKKEVVILGDLNWDCLSHTK